MKKIFSLALIIVAFQIANGQVNKPPTAVNLTITSAAGVNITVPLSAIDIQQLLRNRDSVNQVWVNKTILYERKECFKQTIFYIKFIDSLLKLQTKKKGK